LEALPSAANNEWRSAAEVETWGLTWVASRKGSELWKQFHALDLVRAGSRGKPFWHAEAQAGPLWMQPQVIGRPREDGRITEEKDVRLWNLISCAGGATGILYPRYRPLLDGPLFGAFGAYGMDGSVTPRAEMAAKVAMWANSHAEIWKSRPVRGEIGIVFVPESELFAYVQQGSSAQYAESARGAYQGFFDSNIQADFVHIDDLAQYKAVYLPYPLMLKTETVSKLSKYVENGGVLISEGLPAYFSDHGKAGATQPNQGLDKLFGAKESYVEFTPDLLENLTLEVGEFKIGGRFFLQEYQVAGGTATGRYANGHVAAVENHSGKGRTLLIGTFPGASYFRRHQPESRKFFAGLLDWVGIPRQVTSSDAQVQARLHTGAGGTYLWVVNPTRDVKTVSVGLAAEYRKATDLWQERSHRVDGRRIEVKVDDRNVAVIKLE
jgi:beta-galactosidase